MQLNQTSLSRALQLRIHEGCGGGTQRRHALPCRHSCVKPSYRARIGRPFAGSRIGWGSSKSDRTGPFREFWHCKSSRQAGLLDTRCSNALSLPRASLYFVQGRNANEFSFPA
jgi:hypothetical protein